MSKSLVFKVVIRLFVWKKEIKIMSLFKNIFKSEQPISNKKTLNWIALNELSQLETIEQLSYKKPVLIFKHSTRCGVSSMALKNFEMSYDIDQKLLDLFFLDLLQFRNISNEIVSKFNIPHQSPQVIIISKGKVVYHDSHYGISVDTIKKAI